MSCNTVGMKTRDAVTLAPSTVTRVSTGQAIVPRRPRKSRAAGYPIAIARAHPQALEAALRLAGEDPNRLWLAPDGVVVLNHLRSERCPSRACPMCGEGNWRRTTRAETSRQEPTGSD